MDSNKNLLVFAFLALLIVLGFNYLQLGKRPVQPVINPTGVIDNVLVVPPATVTLRSRNEVLKEAHRVPLENPELRGSINLKGARFDDLILTQYRETTDPLSPQVTLLSPAGSAAPYNAQYAEFSWLASDKDVAVPTSDTEWQALTNELSPSKPLKLTWTNEKGVHFTREITVDDHYMFTVADSVANNGISPVTLYPFGLVARQGNPETTSFRFEGPLGVLGGSLKKFGYGDLVKDRKNKEDVQPITSEGGWLGITYQYWLLAMAPPDNEKISADALYDGTDYSKPEKGHFQTDFRGSPVTISPGSTVQHVTHFLAGAKRLDVLDAYAKKYNILLLDRAIDFGFFYLLAEPLFYLLSFMNKLLGNLGVAILVFTVMLKLVTLPISLKANHNQARMQTLQPEIKRLDERFKDDKLRLNQEKMELFKREKINPMSGCLPMLIQIPILFAMLGVMYTNIEMRHAPFFGWIHDMSVPDPTSWFNLFGLAPWGLPAPVVADLGLFTLYLPPGLHIGAWPLLYGLSMFLLQRLMPQAMDKSQARILMYMPIILTFTLSGMPAGVLIYWTWSNLLSILQQWYITSRDTKGRVRS